MEEQILRFYLKVFSFLFIPIIYLYYIFDIKEIVYKNDFFLIKKSMNYENIIQQNIEDNTINIFFYKNFLKLILLNKTYIHYGKFNIENNNNFLQLIKTIKKPSNYLEKITIVEGWSKQNLNKILSKNFKEFDQIEYYNVIADTYLFSE